MIIRPLRTLVSLFLLIAVFVLAACASEPERKDQQLRKAKTTKPTVEVEEPSPEELGNTPCGNPDWAQLPAGAEAKVPQEKPAQNEEPADTPSDGEDGAETPPDQSSTDQSSTDQSSTGELTASNQPCT